MAKIRFWKWQYTDPLGKDHVMRAPLSRERASAVEHPDRPEWALPLGELEHNSISEHAHSAPK